MVKKRVVLGWMVVGLSGQEERGSDKEKNIIISYKPTLDNTLEE